MRLQKLSLLQSLLVSGLALSNIITAKVITIWKPVVPAGIIIYPFTFFVSNIIGELYERQEAHRTVWCRLVASCWP